MVMINGVRLILQDMRRQRALLLLRWRTVRARARIARAEREARQPPFERLHPAHWEDELLYLLPPFY